MRALGQFRDLDDPDRFVWLRGFADMASRAAPLAAFYDGPVWAAHRGVANTTMIDSDDVLLLRPAWPGAGLSFDAHQRPPVGSTDPQRGVLQVTVLSLMGPADLERLVFARERLVRHCARPAPARSAATSASPRPTRSRDCRCAKASPCSSCWRCSTTPPRSGRSRGAPTGRASSRRCCRAASPSRPERCGSSRPRALPSTPDPAARKTVINDTATPSPADDFDFLIGRWRVAHRRLRRRLQGCTEWDSFSGSSEACKLMDGFANVDDNLIERPAGPYRAVLLRAFDAKAAQWSIGGSTGARRARSTCRCEAPSPTASAASSPTTSSRVGRSACASSGRGSLRTARPGSRRLGRCRQHLGDELDHGLRPRLTGLRRSAARRTASQARVPRLYRHVTAAPIKRRVGARHKEARTRRRRSSRHDRGLVCASHGHRSQEAFLAAPGGAREPAAPMGEFVDIDPLTVSLKAS